jgi:hypothetical protein
VDWKLTTKQRISEEVKKVDQRSEVTTQQEDTRGSIGLTGHTIGEERATKPWHTLLHVKPVI